MKKIFFIHVAKAAGSSFNTFLRQNFTGAEHIESYLTEDGKLIELDYLKQLDYISGHLKLSVFHDNNFSKNEYFLLAFLSEPVSHLLTHLNWVMHIKDKGLDFFNAVPEKIQSMCLQLRNADLYNADVLIENLNEFAWLFQNNQSRYFVRDDNEISPEAVISNMRKLDMVGITEQYESSLKRFIALSELQVKPTIVIENKNSSYRLKQDVLKDKKIRDFIMDYQSIDLEVYEYFKSNSHELCQQPRGK